MSDTLYNQTQAEFEQQKTARIASMCSALQATISIPKSVFGDSPIEELFSRLKREIDSQYYPVTFTTDKQEKK